MKLLGDFWILRVLDSLAESNKRFTELQRDLGLCSPVTLSTKLKKMEDEKLILRSKETEGIAITYSLTPLGNKALPIIEALDNFSKA